MELGSVLLPDFETHNFVNFEVALNKDAEVL